MIKKIFLGISKLIFFPIAIVIRLTVGISLIRLIMIMAIMIGLPIGLVYNSVADPYILAASYAAEVVLAVIARYDIKMLNLQSLMSCSMSFKRHENKRNRQGWGDIQNLWTMASFGAYMAALNFRGIRFRSQREKLEIFTNGVDLGEILCHPNKNKDFTVPVLDHRLEAIIIPPSEKSCIRYLDEVLVLPTILQGIIALILLVVDAFLSETEQLITAFCSGYNQELVESN